MNAKLARAKAALKARQTSFPVLVIDGNASIDPATFRATLYGQDFKPVSAATTDMTHIEVKTRDYFLHRMRTREEWDAEVARAKGGAA